MNKPQEVYQQLKPYIARDFNRITLGTGSSGSAGLPAIWPWNKINFAGSSLANIVNRDHGILQNLGADHHPNYAYLPGRGGGQTLYGGNNAGNNLTLKSTSHVTPGEVYVDDVFRVRDPNSARYRSQYKMTVAGLEILAHDDLGSIYLPITIGDPTKPTIVDASGNLAVYGQVVAAPDTDTTHYFGKAAVGYGGYPDDATFSHRANTAPGDYALRQVRNDATILNAPTGAAIHFRNSNAARMTLQDGITWYPGMASIETDNYFPQETGLRLTYDGQIDARYIYTDQLHAKVFIADLEQALAGMQIITKSVTILASDFTAPFPGLTAPLHVKDLPSAAGMQVFVSGDYVNPREFSRAGGSLDISDCWGTVTSPVDNGDGTQTWTFSRTGTATYNTIAFIANAIQGNASSTTCVINKPTGTVANHVIVANIAWRGSATLTPPSAGWTFVRSQTSGTLNMAIYFKAADGSEPSSYTWTFSAASNNSGSLCTYSNCHVSFLNPIDDSAAQSNSSSTSVSAPGVAPHSAKGMLLFLAAIASNLRATPPAGMTERSDFGNTNVGNYMADVLLSSSTPPGTKTATLGSADDSVAAQVLLLPSWSALSTTAGQMYPYATVEADAITLDYGTTGNGYLEANAVDGLYGVNSPYYQVVTWTTHPATGKTVRVRLGNLAGITDANLTPTGYGLYAQNTYLTGDFVTANGDIRMYQNGGINIAQDIWGSWATNRALQWWPDVSNMTGTPSLAMYTGKPASGVTINQNLAYIDSSPADGVLAGLTMSAIGQGSGANAYVSLEGGSTFLGAPNSSAIIEASTLTLIGATDITSSSTIINTASTSITNQAPSLYMIGDLLMGDPAASTAALWNIAMPAGSGSVNSGNGRNLAITAGSSNNAAGKQGGYLALNGGSPNSPATLYGPVYIANNGGYVSVGGGAPDGLQVTLGVASTARGFDNLRMGISGGAPYIYLEDNTFTQRFISNIASVLTFGHVSGTDMTLDTSGNLVVAGTMKTAADVTFDVGAYSAGVVAQAGYVTVIIGGVSRRLLVG